MRHPIGRCERCGERLYGHVDGGSLCLNCGKRRLDDEDENDGKAVLLPTA
ncbi:hypothetical protein ACFOZ7_06005 [Natribaculum luteum]|uniref:Rubrerythrin-like domain-containing protein n=1 Tax=Natribaculum luteum TaxID=1586232 RepID=A0ABD5NX07_9EURY|nr:hypothetical protein [Natribaculum luteum]